ncbi:prostaglandin E synthase isoform X3 [Panthera tigris]|uniref:prostaglandin E synthase isoform X3 n=1 Tax=Panthera tigris TaxID=9694 RepID=UPI001C6F8BF5|nr:prostaglandin E synthase isoform X3 [Panthera tigris]
MGSIKGGAWSECEGPHVCSSLRRQENGTARERAVCQAHVQVARLPTNTREAQLCADATPGAVCTAAEKPAAQVLTGSPGPQPTAPQPEQQSVGGKNIPLDPSPAVRPGTGLLAGSPRLLQLIETQPHAPAAAACPRAPACPWRCLPLSWHW